MFIKLVLVVFCFSIQCSLIQSPLFSISFDARIGDNYMSCAIDMEWKRSSHLLPNNPYIYVISLTSINDVFFVYVFISDCQMYVNFNRVFNRVLAAQKTCLFTRFRNVHSKYITPGWPRGCTKQQSTCFHCFVFTTFTRMSIIQLPLCLREEERGYFSQLSLLI